MSDNYLMKLQEEFDYKILVMTDKQKTGLV
jgi:hypothetical protein